MKETLETILIPLLSKVSHWHILKRWMLDQGKVLHARHYHSQHDSSNPDQESYSTAKNEDCEGTTIYPPTLPKT